MPQPSPRLCTLESCGSTTSPTSTSNGSPNSRLRLRCFGRRSASPTDAIIRRGSWPFGQRPREVQGIGFPSIVVSRFTTTAPLLITLLFAGHVDQDGQARRYAALPTVRVNAGFEVVNVRGNPDANQTGIEGLCHRVVSVTSGVGASIESSGVIAGSTNDLLEGSGPR
jgi:hypothetical protein